MSALRQASQVFISGELTPEMQSARFAVMAEADRDALIGAGRASPAYDTFVDGRQGGDEMTARRTILFRFHYLGDAARYALQFLAARAPVLTGAFRESFFVAVDGRSMGAASFLAASVPETAEIIIGDLQPYDRKIDVQRAGNRRLHYSMPPDMYAGAARAVRARFGGTVLARRTHNARFPGQYVLRRGPDKGSRVSSPGLVLTAFSAR